MDSDRRTFRSPKRRRVSARELGLIVLIAGLGAAVVIALGWADLQMAKSVGRGGEFLSPWDASRQLLLRGEDPYGPEPASFAQLSVYGRPASRGENPYRLTLPLFLLPFYFPLALIPEPALARAIWIVLGQAALAATTVLAAGAINWQPRRPGIAVLGVTVVLSAYAAISLWEGSPALFLVWLVCGALWAYAAGLDELAGACLALSLFAWEAGAAFLLLLLMRILQDKRWRVLGGFGMALVVLLGLSFLIVPSWPLPFLAANLAAARADFGVTSFQALQRLLPAQGTRIAQGLAVLLVVLLLVEWTRTRLEGFRTFVWTSCLALAGMPLLGLRGEISNLVVLSPCIVVISAAAMSRGRFGAGFALAYVLISLVVPWVLLRQWVVTADSHFRDWLFLFWPAFVILGLYWTRWWFIRPQRTWLDEVRGANRAA